MRFPQSIAHRGFQAQYPENTMRSFIGAVNAGTHALETDLHLTRDNVVVLSHDPTLLRCFGVDKRIIDCDYEYIRTLTTVKSPPQRMPTLKELLAYLREPEATHLWLLLDIKLDNHPENVMRLAAEALAEVGGEGAQSWEGRVTLGIWALKYVALCERYLPDFPIAHIGTSIAYAREFLNIPGAAFNLHYAALANASGKKFLSDARKEGRNVFAWTVNDERLMKWSICHKIDGVCVDDIPRYFRVCTEYDPGSDCPPAFWGWKMELELRSRMLIGWLLSQLRRLRYCEGMKGLVWGWEKKMLEQHWQVVQKRSRQAFPPVGMEDEGQKLVNI